MNSLASLACELLTLWVPLEMVAGPVLVYDKPQIPAELKTTIISIIVIRRLHRGSIFKHLHVRSSSLHA